MPRTPRLPLLSALLLAIGCAPAPQDAVPANAAPATARERSDLQRPADALMPADAALSDGATPAGQWHLQESYPPRAVWGVPASEGQLDFACDRAQGQLVMTRHAVGVPDGVRLVSLEADGTRMDYPAERRDTALAPMLVTPIALDAPIVDRLLVARRMVVTAGSDAIVTTAPGEALRAVVDACRPPAAG